MKQSAVADARKVMSDAFKKDPDFYRAYHANVAMRLYDLQYQMCPKTKSVRRLNFRDKNVRDKVADSIMKLIFD